MNKQRDNSLDVARALLLILGIPFHLATVSVFDLKEPAYGFRDSVPISVFMSINHSFRMFAFFILSGFFSAMVIEKRGKKDWLRDRTARLGVPLVVSMFTLGVLQFWIYGTYIAEKYPATLVGLPIQLNHLWFLIVLLMFVFTLYFFPSPNINNRRFLHDAITVRGYNGAIFLIILGFWGLLRAILDRISGDHFPINIISNYIYFLPAFFIGYIAFTPSIRSIFFKEFSRLKTAILIALLCIHVSLDTLARPALGLTDPKSVIQKIVSNGLELPLALIASSCLFSILSKVVTREHTIVRFLVNGAMAIYLFHMLWVYVVAKALTLISWPSEIEWILGSVAVFILSVITYKLTNISPWLSAGYSGGALPTIRIKRDSKTS